MKWDSYEKKQNNIWLNWLLWTTYDYSVLVLWNITQSLSSHLAYAWEMLLNPLPCNFAHFWKYANIHDDVIKWKHFPRNWPLLRGIHRSPVNSPHKGQWRGASMFSLIWMKNWVNNRKAGDLRRYRAHCDVIVLGYLFHIPLLIDKCRCSCIIPKTKFGIEPAWTLTKRTKCTFLYTKLSVD